MKLLSSILITLILSVSTVGVSGRMRYLKSQKHKAPECDSDITTEVFNCVNTDSNDHVDLTEADNEYRLCYDAHREKDDDYLTTLFECVDKNSDGNITIDEGKYFCGCHVP